MDEAGGVESRHSYPVGVRRSERERAWRERGTEHPYRAGTIQEAVNARRKLAPGMRQQQGKGGEPADLALISAAADPVLISAASPPVHGWLSADKYSASQAGEMSVAAERHGPTTLRWADHTGRKRVKTRQASHTAHNERAAILTWHNNY